MKITREIAAHYARKKRARKAVRTRIERYGLELMREVLATTHQYGMRIRQLRRAIKALENPAIKHQEQTCYCPYHTASEYLFDIRLIQDQIDKLLAERNQELTLLRRRIHAKKHEAALARALQTGG